MKKTVEGLLIVRGFITFTVDKAKSTMFGRTVRGNTKERFLSIEEIEAGLEDKESDISRYGFAILYAFHGKINDRPVSFDTQSIEGNRPEIKTLGYARASILEGGKIYLTASFNEVQGYERPGVKFKEDGLMPDILAAIKLDDLEDGATLKYRAFKEADERFFPEASMLNLFFEPGHFNKAAPYIIDGAGKKATKRRGRKPNPDKVENTPLPDKEMLGWVEHMIESESESFNGFRIESRTPRIIILEKDFENGGSASVKFLANSRSIVISYLAVVDEETVWKVYKEWKAEPKADTAAIKKEIRLGLVKILGAFKG